MRIAALSSVLAKHLTKLSPDKAMVVGLLHDIGKFYILSRAHQYQGLFSSQEILWDLIDQWHVDIGAAILDSWEVSEDIHDAVMNQKRRNFPAKGKAGLTDIVAAANFLDASFVSESLNEIDWANIPFFMQNLQLDKETSENLMSKTRLEIAQILKIIS